MASVGCRRTRRCPLWGPFIIGRGSRSAANATNAARPSSRPIAVDALSVKRSKARRRETAKRLLKVEGKLSGIQKNQNAKSILMELQGLSEDGAYQALRQRAMGKARAMEEMAAAIINANELLQSRPKGD